MVVWYVCDKVLPYIEAEHCLGMWKDRVLQSEFRDNAIKMRIASEEELATISKAWGDFPSTQDAWYTVVHGEMICTK